MHDLVELKDVEPGIRLDIRYATSNNFVGRPVYDQARAFLQRPAAEALARVHQSVAEHGLGILVFDAYRPWAVTKIFWDVVAPEHRIFVANPESGSKHNRGCAVDCTLYSLDTGENIPMPSGFDEFTKRAFTNYQEGPEDALKNRELLIASMAREEFSVNSKEWWHYDHARWELYGILDVSFDEAAIGIERPS